MYEIERVPVVAELWLAVLANEWMNIERRLHASRPVNTVNDFQISEHLI